MFRDLSIGIRHRIGNYFYAINQPYSSTLGRVPWQSRGSAIVCLCRIFEKILIFLIFVSRNELENCPICRECKQK